jgi:iron(III) transport system ATP-binding protein
MNVHDNMAFGLLRRRKFPSRLKSIFSGSYNSGRKIERQEINRKVTAAAATLGIKQLLGRRPAALSGGQRQRVALGRALVREPKVFLLDEPLSNLDASLRLEMRAEIRRICKQTGLTAIYVTHDQKEALSIADRMAIMRDGIIEQIGTPEDIYRRPINRFVAGFIGEANFVPGVVCNITDATITVETICGVFVALNSGHSCTLNEKVELCIRPENIRFDKPISNLPNRLHGHFLESTYLGEVSQHLISIPEFKGMPLTLKAFERSPLAGHNRMGAPADIWIAQEHVIITKS